MIIAVIAVSLLGVVPSTGASTVSTVRIEGHTLSFVAADGTGNRVTVQQHSGVLRIVDTGSTVVPVSPCVADASTAARCPATGILRVVLDLGDGDDNAQNLTCTPSLMIGRGEDDQLTGGCGNDVIYGGPGKDKIRGGWGDDQIFAEAGDDFVDGEQGLGDMGDGGPDNDFCTLTTETRVACP